jgi:hypothetical protein
MTASAIAAVSLAACTSSARDVASDSPQANTSTPAQTCQTPTLDGENSFKAAATGGEVNALVFGPLPPQSGTDLKVVWRVTGGGDLSVTAERPDGSESDLTFGPEPHGSSNFSRPGDEWGTGFRFDEPGCWRLTVQRGAVLARVMIEVLP